jgi:hypothetical protein
MKSPMCLSRHGAKLSETDQPSTFYQIADRECMFKMANHSRPKKTFLQPRRKMEPLGSYETYEPLDSSMKILHQFISPLAIHEGSSLLYHKRLPFPDSRPRCVMRKRAHHNTIVVRKMQWLYSKTSIASTSSSRIEFEPPLHAPPMPDILHASRVS